MRYLFILALLTLFACNTSNESKADSYNNDGDYKKAIEHYKLAIEEGSVASMDKLAFLYANNNQKEEALKYNIMSFENGSVTAAQTLSSLSLSNFKYDDVIKYSKKLADEGNIDLVYNLGSAYLKLEKYDLAIKYLLLDKESVYIKDPLGEAYYKKGDAINAEKYWKSAVDDHNSGAVNSHRKLLKLYLEQGRDRDYKLYEHKY